MSLSRFKDMHEEIYIDLYDQRKSNSDPEFYKSISKRELNECQFEMISNILKQRPEFKNVHYITLTFNGDPEKWKSQIHECVKHIKCMYTAICQNLIGSKYYKPRNHHKQPPLILIPELGQDTGLHFHGFLFLSDEQLDRTNGIKRIELKELKGPEIIQRKNYDRWFRAIHSIRNTLYDPNYWYDGYEKFLNFNWKKNPFCRQIRLQKFEGESLEENFERAFMYSVKHDYKTPRDLASEWQIFPISRSEFANGQKSFSINLTSLFNFR